MDTSTLEQKKELETVFRHVVKKGTLNEKQQNEVFEKLEGAIVLRTGGMLIDGLNTSNRKLFEEREFGNTEELFQFLADTTTKEEFKKVAARATEEVLASFLEKISKKM